MVTATAVVLLQLLATTGQDDARLLRDVRAAQQRFERVRRAHLPRVASGVRPERCDARVGRFCYWYDSTESKPVAEPPQTVAARAELLAYLDSAYLSHHGVAWLGGQLTRYLIEAGRADEAVARARECTADRWWCAALEGVALHVATRYAEADSVFGDALAAMSAAQRCEWLDLRLVLPPPLATEWERAGCDDRARLASRLWIVAKPLWSTAGNDLRTEHLARLTMAAIFTRTANAYGTAWSTDSRELMIRYGWADWFTRDELNPYTLASPTVTGHDREPSYSFFPGVASAADTTVVDADSWQLREPTAHSRYAPRHLERLTALEHQLVRFPRGDSTLIAVAFGISDSVLAGDTLSAFLGVLRDTLVTGIVRRGHVLQLAIPNDTVIASIEATGAASRHAARARYTVAPLPCDAHWCVSDLVLFDDTPRLAHPDASAALERAVTARVSNRTPLGVLWEMQADSGVAITSSVTVSPVRVSLVRRLAARLHLASEPAAVRLRWDSRTRSARETQSVTLRLPESARGRYRVQLTVTRAGMPDRTASRDVDLAP